MASRGANPCSPVQSIAKIEQSLGEFGRSMQSCLILPAYSNEHFVAVQSDVLHTANVYRVSHLPASKKLLSDLGDFMGDYVDIDFELFQRTIHLRARQAKKHAESAQMVADLHHSLLVDVAAVVHRTDKAAALAEMDVK